MYDASKNADDAACAAEDAAYIHVYIGLHHAWTTSYHSQLRTDMAVALHYY